MDSGQPVRALAGARTRDQMKPIVFTAIFGGYDKLCLPDIARGKYVCLCDEQLDVREPWQRRLIEVEYEPRKQARYCKILAHRMFPDADITIWHGGNVRLTVDPQELVNLLGEGDIAVLKHARRNCAYREADACIRFKKGDPEIIKQQMRRYHKEGYPERNGLCAACLIVRRHTPQIAEFNELWWAEVDGGSVRDQLSINYCMWKMGIRPVVIPGDMYRGPHYRRTGAHHR